jgi:hypothetical protein
VIDIIIKDLNEAREIIDDLKKYPEVPELQVELAKSKCKSASELITLLKNLPGKAAPASEEKSIVTEEIRKEDDSYKSHHTVPSPEGSYKKEVVEAQITQIAPEAKEKPASTFKKPPESSIIADQFSNRPESYNEKLSSIKQEDDLLEILKTKPLSSLDEAIGVNDRFVFIREIFNGDQDSYNQAILKLETVGCLADARAVIMSYTGEDADNEAITQLLDLLKRKFPSNE